MQVLLPKISTEKIFYPKWKPMSDNEYMSYKYKMGDTTNLMNFMNKSPEWNAAVGRYTLDFKGRVLEPSIKNFQLIDPINSILNNAIKIIKRRGYNITIWACG